MAIQVKGKGLYWRDPVRLSWAAEDFVRTDPVNYEVYWSVSNVWYRVNWVVSKLNSKA